MLVIAILATIASLGWSLFVPFANGMSDAQGGRTRGYGTVIAAWVATATLWLAWLAG